ncbi:MAG: hypothetical protein WDO74_30730 [Pseudomonadota bacterium]
MPEANASMITSEKQSAKVGSTNTSEVAKKVSQLLRVGLQVAVNLDAGLDLHFHPE